MSLLTLSQLNDNKLLEQQQHKSWQQFSQQHAESYQILTQQQLEHFKIAITLSDFVLASALQAPELVLDLFVSKSVYLTSTPAYETLLQDLLIDCKSEEQLHKILRNFRLEHMVNIAIADLVLNIDLEKSLERLSLLADALIQTSLHWLTEFCQEKWGVPTSNDGQPQPLLVYGMGKLGGKELNFSSDIDLIFVYPYSGETKGCRRSLDNQQFFTRLAQKLITSLHQQTADGFVYRVDMRLRPFGDSGPLVLTFNAMEDYYQEQGRDWERYAMLKARVIPNLASSTMPEEDYHQQLTAMLKPFVYRRYIDFSVIDSLRKMKSMISQEVRRKQLVNNIKLGAGGIREIEFIVQVFQLIRGGRVEELQQRNLLTVLPQLVIAGELEEDNKRVLQNAYCFLRRVENILQALADKQTQTLPENDLDKQRLLIVLKIDTWEDFMHVLQGHMNDVHETFEQLIGVESPNHQAEDQHWSVLWNSRWSDEESIAWVEQEQTTQDSVIWNSEAIWRLLSDFRDDVSKRSIGSRGRQVLDKLIPLLICHIKQAKQAEFVLERVLHVFKRIVTRTAYLELLFENEGALKQLIHLCQASSWVTDYIAKYPILLDELIDPTLLHNPPQLSTYGVELRESMLRIPEEDLEAQMDGLRLFKQAQQLRIAAADIAGVLDVITVSDHLTALAEAIINEVINIAWQQVANRFGVPTSTIDSENKGFGVIAYGKTGGKELSYGSDLDLVFVHNSPQGEETTGLAGGSKVVSSSQFYVKFAQRIMHIFNTRMNSGILYELDMRLRPSGNAGILVIHINNFGQYQQEEAWTWEHQALVRARIVYGNKAIIDTFKTIREEVLNKSRDKVKLKEEVKMMREKMRNHLDKSTDTHLDIKQGAGGLVDIEFIAQYLVLAHSCEHKSLTERCDNLGIFKLLAKLDILTSGEQDILTSNYQQLRHLGHVATLRNENLLIDNSLLPEKEQVSALWHKFIE
ncbi:bifunctional [glutamate--ammonia ligase]-adenylyl-L-tyrosine phosphorylase/[glutamate--ammonia-ligase] adenylyltransferase [Colwellia sp. 1_MG-2023]|uniref:bifunctional [glutamate--ammonia ligase]-adenylyl-L-tyrosine phosphorylase/[glutamate--ammonia-ligase] adenylyltransferase n=1 Tax=unclassified Colwellia TaxID=196834 RepID=UPI0020904DF7|nr:MULTISPECIES: bifunctional [glutamate--ammonia ligase]-adenylyl-L-tyrosine phosphorylase/[glutamate--ammonia-ligase] adenylyltransferase [unclassified Colwellia]MDO6653447.1 bifunctional [glutamate--ammonia ligase]-adenylyl-L-tyrosine phosphorylase/[glutamate--ammonia-ligase] adenylyltransferase [Colwellia sp. 3_MG-2023]MDO6666295.1 bifunctional [glutamate--ammonia ligase]-adenylyl-L-tyrosine phosphorylase/[glutamate--ammonia-ligase] adenylyltransferase [Colwellia sp. 2_MG-2023]MDO6690604.1 b